MDRDVQADDNAEHLYRYFLNNHDGFNIKFVLRKNSPDWERLKEDGFNLIPFGSIRHMIAMLNARHLISSHADNYVFNFPPQRWFKGIMNYHYTFLQHGVIKDDLSSWLNKKPIDLFTTTSKREYSSIVESGHKYKFTSREVCLSGLARHDELIRKSQSSIKSCSKKMLLIMPTWRQGLVGESGWMTNTRSKNSEFYDSQYAQVWKHFLHSDLLKTLVDQHKLEVVFFPHTNILPYIEWFDAPSHIRSLSPNDIDSIQDLFVNATFMVTDYSSVAFEMAYLGKSVLYYQFDKDKVFGGDHLTKKGYFDYDKDGFGRVFETEDNLIIGIKDLLDKNCIPDDRYLDRMNNTFEFKDGKCCERIFNAIVDLDETKFGNNN